MTTSALDIAISVNDIVKTFGEIRALDGLSLSVPRGTVLGLLGPNGSGKTTLVRILTTLSAPDSGSALVEGHDVVHEAAIVRRLIGLAGQFSAIDDHLTGYENLHMSGRLYHLHPDQARMRALELLEQFNLADAAERQVKTYSGGMRRRLDLAACLVARPAVLFLDEPTTGLDPRSRIELWSVLRDLVDDGATLLLTTQYLDEADQLADNIVVIDRGLVIAEGTSGELKDRVGGDVLECTVAEKGRLVEAAAALAALGSGTPQIDESNNEVAIAVGNSGSSVLVAAVRRLDRDGIEIADLALRRPSLDDVFLALTGHAASDKDPESADLPKAKHQRGGRRRRRRGAEQPGER